MTIQICIFERQECVVIAFRIEVRVASIIQCHKPFLLLCFSDIFNRIASPYLSFLDNSARWNHTVWCNNSSLLKNSSLQNNRIMSNIHLLFNCTGVKSAVVLNYSVTFYQELGSQSSGRCGSCMKYTVITNTYISNQSTLNTNYVILLISPRMTVPCQIAMSVPMNTSPTTVALGATKIKP